VLGRKAGTRKKKERHERGKTNSGFESGKEDPNVTVFPEEQGQLGNSAGKEATDV